MKRMKKIGFLSAVVLVAGIAFLVARFWCGTHRGKLPWSARNVQTYHKSYGPQGFTYCLKAELPKSDFLEYATRLRASHYSESPHLNYRDGHDIHWPGGGPSNWWNPSSVKTNTYGRPNGVGLLILKYENGYVYLKDTGS